MNPEKQKSFMHHNVQGQGWSQRAVYRGGGSGDGGVTGCRSFEPSAASGGEYDRGGGGGGLTPSLCLWECISSDFEAHFSIFYNLNF